MALLCKRFYQCTTNILLLLILTQLSLENATNEEIYKRLPITINPTQLGNATPVNHTYYNSSFIGQPGFFHELWANISKMKFKIHPLLRDSYRRFATVPLSFDFPYYGYSLKNVTIATGGFISTSERAYHWLFSTQYIAPLMANFDTSQTNDSVIKYADDGTNFTVVWENVTLKGDKNNTFTFAVILRKDGDILFAYKDVPIAVQDIVDTDHPVRVGFSDAYIQDKEMFFTRHKFIFEYHRVSFLNHNITSGTVLRLGSLPTCLLYKTCQDCRNHKTSFNCTWCPAVERCSCGMDRMKEEWELKNCNKIQTTKEADCPPSTMTTNSSVAKTDYAPPVQSQVVTENSKKEAALVSSTSTEEYSSLS